MDMKKAKVLTASEDGVLAYEDHRSSDGVGEISAAGVRQGAEIISAEI
jgi:hypothetical protein